ncbi:MAG: hypothetical protein LBG84_01340 [Treponema sp.]|jgi:hypothetical protein|nr:hypothetical protein [Treponema sp.]
MNRAEYQKALEEALNARAEWLEKNELPKFKDEFRVFHNSFTCLYRVLLQKKLINEDPYKQEAKVGEITIPRPISLEGDRMDQLTMNLSAYDNQLDFLVNFFPFSVDTLNLENIKRVLGILKYIDWTRFNMDAPTSTTKAVVDVVNQTRVGGLDSLTANTVNEALDRLNKGTGVIMGFLKNVTAFNRESYKLELRRTITGSMNSATVEEIKKKCPAKPGKPFYPDLAEELIKEDFSSSGEKLRDEALKQLAIPETKPKTIKKEVSFKTTLLEGLVIIGSIAAALGESVPRLDENSQLFQNRKRGLLEKLTLVFKQMINKEPEPAIYEIEYADNGKGTPAKEKLNFDTFRTEVDKKLRAFASLSGRGSAVKLEAMEEKQLAALLEKTIREAQALHKVLTGLDDYFKAEAPRESRDKIRGIKPELGTMKNAIIRANQKRHEYNAQVEEGEQLKKLGINPAG